MCESGATNKELMDEFGCKMYAIRRRIKDYNIERGSKLSINEDIIISLYDKYGSLNRVSTETGYSNYIIKKVLVDHGLYNIDADIDEEDIVRMFNNNISIENIMKKHKISYIVLLSLIKKHDLRRGNVQMKDYDQQELVGLYNEGRSIEEISKVLGVNIDNVRDYVRTNNMVRNHISIIDLDRNEFEDYYRHNSLEKTADHFGISIDTVYERLDDYGIHRDDNNRYSHYDNTSILYNENRFHNYLLMHHNKPSVRELMKFFNASQQTVDRYIRKYDARSLVKRRTSSYALVVERWLMQNNINILDYEYRIDYDGGFYKYDLLVEKVNKNRKNGRVLLEINPTCTHHVSPIGGNVNSTKGDKYYHYNKSRVAWDHGLRLVHIFEDKLSSLDNLLGFLLPSKNITNYSIGYEEGISGFIKDNHRQSGFDNRGYVARDINEDIVAAMTFRKTPKDGEFKLNRLVFKKGTIVHGFSKKALSMFINDYNPSKIVTFCDASVNSCGVYKRLGFEEVGVNLNYHWAKGDDFISREKCQKYKLVNKYNLNPDKWSENSIMENIEKRFKVYDMINKKYVMELI
jgi:transposase